MELTNYMKRDLYFAGFKAFNRGESDSPYQAGTEADQLWRDGWASAQCEASEA